MTFEHDYFSFDSNVWYLIPDDLLLSHSSQNMDSLEYGSSKKGVKNDDNVCPICDKKYDFLKIMKTTTCCHIQVCKHCLIRHARQQIGEGYRGVECVNYGCSEKLEKQFLKEILDKETMIKYYNNSLLENANGLAKSCPKCQVVKEISSLTLIKMKSLAFFNKEASFVSCSGCKKKWCFPCGTISHEGYSCGEYQKNVVPFQDWMNKRNDNNEPNAQQCPKCGRAYFKYDGCVVMFCKPCKIKFCYLCGDRYYSSGPFKHRWRFSVCGCKYAYSPNNPVKRIFVRTTVSGAYVIVAPVVLISTIIVAPFLYTYDKIVGN